MNKLLATLLCSLAACANNGAGGATVNATCPQGSDTADTHLASSTPSSAGPAPLPSYSAVHNSCVVIITPGTATATPDITTMVTPNGGASSVIPAPAIP